MAQRKINLLLVAASVIGGLLASYTGEIMLAAWQDRFFNSSTDSMWAAAGRLKTF
ncbi:hypothetical protein [Aneurinibacillus tyrosinisolvens]|uniref:hypothetical protein n=1 Tax=Aneurinibacillus tyrosinisolvens TaxID=1443435 RepID=UPI000B122B84|nr:hypothetical protein [Aneurinibacillus tyrosinisolvens]